MGLTQQKNGPQLESEAYVMRHQDGANRGNQWPLPRY